MMASVTVHHRSCSSSLLAHTESIVGIQEACYGALKPPGTWRNMHSTAIDPPCKRGRAQHRTRGTRRSELLNVWTDPSTAKPVNRVSHPALYPPLAESCQSASMPTSWRHHRPGDVCISGSTTTISSDGLLVDVVEEWTALGGDSS
jgi:hypothetical protein